MPFFLAFLTALWASVFSWCLLLYLLDAFMRTLFPNSVLKYSFASSSLPGLLFCFLEVSFPLSLLHHFLMVSRPCSVFVYSFWRCEKHTLQSALRPLRTLLSRWYSSSSFHSLHPCTWYTASSCSPKQNSSTKAVLIVEIKAGLTS